MAQKPLFERYNFNEFTYKDLKEDLGWFMYGEVKPEKPINTISEVDVKINESAKQFEAQIKDKETTIGQAQAENEKKLFYTFIYAARDLWKRLVNDPKTTFTTFFSTKKEVLKEEVVTKAKYAEKVAIELVEIASEGSEVKTAKEAATAVVTAENKTKELAEAAVTAATAVVTAENKTKELAEAAVTAATAVNTIAEQAATPAGKVNNEVAKKANELVTATQATQAAIELLNKTENKVTIPNLEKYLNEEKFQRIKEEANYKVTPLEAVQQKTASYITKPFDRISNSLERLIKLWVPYRFMYYTIYDQDPHQIEDFKDKIREFEATEKLQSGSFDRMMLALIQLIQLSSINDEYRAAIMKDLGSIFGDYKVDTSAPVPVKGGADGVYYNKTEYPPTKQVDITPIVNYLNSADYKGSESDKKATVAYVKDITQKPEAELKPIDMVILNVLESIVAMMTGSIDTLLAAKQTSSPDMITNLFKSITEGIDATLQEKVTARANTILEAITRLITEGTEQAIQSKPTEEVVKVIAMLQDTATGIEMLLKEKSVAPVQQAVETVVPQVAPVAPVPARDERREQLIRELKNKAVLNDATLTCDETITNDTLEALNNNVAAVLSFLGLQNITEINDDKLTKQIYSKDTTNRITDTVQASKVNTPIDCSTPDLTDLNNLFGKLKAHIDKITQVRVVLSFNKGGPDYTDEGRIEEIVKNQFSLTDKPTENKTGPFYKYLTGGTNGGETIKSFIETDVVSDVVAALTEKKHIIYTGYGFSGSGKSYTLLEGQETILSGVLKKLEGVDGVTVKVYELYGEDPDTEAGECKSTEPITPGQIYYYNISDPTNITYDSTPLSNPINVNDFRTNKDSILKNIQTVRQKNYKKEGEPTEFHIRPTPNNPNSSRAHIFYEFTIPNTGSKITLIDMGGTEDVNDIEKMYYTVDKIYDAKNDSIQKTLQDNFNPLTTKTFNISGDTLIDSLKRDLIIPLNNITTTLQKDTPVPNGAAWKTLKDTNILSEDEFNIITAYIKALDTVKQAAKYYVRNIVDSVLLPDYQKSIIDIIDKQLNITVPNTNKAKFNDANKQYITKLINKCYILNENTYNRNSTIDDYVTALECYLVLKALLLDTKFNATAITQFTSNFNSSMKHSTVNASARNSYNNFISSIQSTSTTITTNDEAEKAFTDFTAIETEFKSLIQKYHCPLRRQGNYINRSIKDLEYFAYDLTGDTTTKPVSTKSTQLAELLTKDFQQDYKTQTKLTVIAALRTDDAHKPDINKTLEFAHCINPFSNKNPPNYNCTPSIMAPAKAKKGGATPTPNPSPQPTPQQPSTEPLITPAKMTEDVEAVKTYLKKSTELKQVLADVDSVWTSYTKVTPQKTFKDLKIYSLLDSLIGELKKDTDPSGVSYNDAKTKNIFRTLTSTEKPNDSLNYTEFKNNNYLVYNFTEKQNDKSRKDEFNKKRKLFVEQFKELSTALENIPTFKSSIEGIKNIHTNLEKIIAAPATTPLIEKDNYKSIFTQVETTAYYKLDTYELQKFLINDIKANYDLVPGYTAEEVKGSNSYLQKSAETIKKDLVDKLTKVSTEYSKLIDDLTKQAKRYATFNPSIKNRILLALEPKDGSPSEVSKIMERINFIIGKMKADIDVNKSSFEKAAEGMKTEKKGGGYLLCHPAYLAQLGGAVGTEDVREEIKAAFDKTKEGETTNLYKYINLFDQLAKTFVSNLQRSSDPIYSLTTQGNESLFNTLFNKYKESKSDTSKGEYVAAMELSEGLEANNLLPRKVLEITYLDKTIFIFATLFIRLIALAITDYLIDTDKLQRLGYAFLAYLGIYIGIFYVLLLIVNLDDYKLRILFNYLNMHGNSSVAVMHPALVGVFGAIIYYVMLNINKGYGYTVASEEDRVRLKYKIQVISLVIWMFTSLLVLLM